MLLKRALLAHEFGFLGGVGFAVNDAIKKSIEKSLEACIDIGNAHALLGGKRSARVYIILALAFETHKHLVRPVFPQCKGHKEPRYFRFEGFLACIWLRAFLHAIFLCATIVGVPLLNFASDSTATLGTPEKSEKHLALRVLVFGRVAEAAIEDDLRVVKKLFGNQRFMRPFMNLSRILKMSVVNGVRQNAGDNRTTQKLSTFSAHAALRQEIPHGVECLFPCGIPFKHFSHEGRAFFINDDAPCAIVVEVANRCATGKLALPHFLAKPALHIFGKRIYIIFTETEFSIKHELSLRVVLKPTARKFKQGEFPRIEKVNDATAVNAVASKAVGMPRKNARCLSLLNAIKHRIENWSARNLGGLLLHQFSNNREIVAFGKLAQFGKLCLYGEDLLVLDISRFSSVEKICIHIFSVYHNCVKIVSVFNSFCPRLQKTLWRSD